MKEGIKMKTRIRTRFISGFMSLVLLSLIMLFSILV